MNKLKNYYLLFSNKIIKAYENFSNEERAMGTIEIVLILVVLIGLVIVFKGSIINVLNDILSNIENSAKSVY